MEVKTHGCPSITNQTIAEDTNSSIFVVYTVAMIPLALLVVVGNTMVIAAVYMKRDLRTPTNLVLTSLAVANLMIGLVACPLQSFALYEVFTPQYTTSIVLTFPYIVFSGIGFVHIVALTVDRHLAITRPLRYANLVTSKRVGLGIVFTWVICIVGFAVRATVSIVKNRLDGRAIICEPDEFVSPLARVQTLIILALISISAPALIASNVRILYIAMKQSRSISAQRDAIESSGRTDLPDGRGLKAVKTTAMVVGVFLLSWVPVFTYFLAQLADVGGALFRNVLSVAALLSVVVSSAINPYIYCSRDHGFRRAFLKPRLCKAPRRRSRRDLLPLPGDQGVSICLKSNRCGIRGVSLSEDTDVNDNSISLIKLAN